MTVFLSRSAWNALPPNRPSQDRDETTILFVHHSATLNPTSTPRPDDIEEAKEQWRAFQTDHLNRPVSSTNPMLWADLAYNVGVGPGVILEGRGWDERGGGTGKGERVQHPSGSWDNVSVSICVIGNYQTEDLDPLTRASLVEAFREARQRYGDLEVMVDRDVNFTSCCGDRLIPLVPTLWAESGDIVTPADIEAIAQRTQILIWERMIDVKNDADAIESHAAIDVLGFTYEQARRAAKLAKVAITTEEP